MKSDQLDTTHSPFFSLGQAFQGEVEKEIYNCGGFVC